jgi:flagellar biosynthetic protein FliO
MDTISLVSSFLKMIFALAIVLGLLFGVMYFVKRFMSQVAPASDNQALINILSSRYLGPKSSIILVEVMDHVIVVGISNQQMTTLACIDNPLAVAEIKAKRTSSPAMNSPANKIASYISSLNLSSGRQKDKNQK